MLRNERFRRNRLAFGVAGDQRGPAARDWLVMQADARHDLAAQEPTRFLLALL